MRDYEQLKNIIQYYTCFDNYGTRMIMEFDDKNMQVKLYKEGNLFYGKRLECHEIRKHFTDVDEKGQLRYKFVKMDGKSFEELASNNASAWDYFKTAKVN